MVKKPENLCDEVGCTNHWKVVVKIMSYPDDASASSTLLEKRVCELCAYRLQHSKVEPYFQKVL